MKKGRSLQQPERRRFLRVLGGGVVGFLLGTIGGRRSAVDAAGTGDSVLAPIPRRPRPATLSPALFEGKTARAYRIAREVPELIERMPCYCGCFKGNGHRNNLDCYVDRHAFGWDMCQDITLEAYAMYKEGNKIPEIKAVIDRKHAKSQPWR